MDLFKKLSGIMTEGSTLSITVAKSKSGLSVSVLPGNSLVKDTAKNKFVPIVLSGTADDMDEGFVDAISQPVAKANGLLANIKDFEQATEEAKNASEMEKKAKEEAKKLNENFGSWLALSEQNYGEHKFKDALTCIANAEKIAGKINGGITKVDAMRKKINEAMGEGSMFGAISDDKSDGKNVKLGKTVKAAAEPADDEEDKEE